MKYTPYSFSKISTWHACPRRFKYNYIDKIKTEWVRSIPLERGTLIHLIFELERDIAKIKKHKDFIQIKERGILDSEAIKGCFKVYDNFIKSKAGNQLISKKRLFAEMPLGLSHDLEIMEYNPSDKEGIDNLFLRGYIDSAVISEGKEEDTLIVIDWKSGKYKTKDQQEWDQLLYYAIGLFSKMPFDKIILCYAYVEHDKLNLKEVFRKDIEKYKTALYNNVDKIETDIVFEKNETVLCSWCDYQNHCLNDTEDLPF